jgi:predicted nucleic acid-binding protein
MPGRAFLDSKVLIYALGDNDARREIADSLLALGPVVSTQVLAETAAVLRRRFQAPPATIAQVLEAILPRVHCEPLTAAMVVSALHVGERLGYAHYDSQIIAAPLAMNCEVLYSEDLQHGQVIDGRLAIVNPFVS